MEIIRTKTALKKALKNFGSKKIALVPTMGFLHDGHLQLVELAKKSADKVVVSIFVNPTQFGAGEDFEKYPRDENGDLKKLKALKADIVYIPKITEIYGQHHGTTIHVQKDADILCGKFRKGHFDGVATIVAKLLNQVTPDIAIFGEKDYQQLHIIREMVSDLDIDTKIIGAKIIREKDGLALSSRNSYLSKKEREIAPELFRTLSVIRGRIEEGEEIKKVISWGKSSLKKKGFSKIDYIEIRDSKTLEEVTKIKSTARIFAAAHLGKTRLIDNLEIKS